MRLLLRIMLLTILLGLVACQRVDTPKLDLKGTDVSQMDVGGDFSLMDHTGVTRSLSAYRGKVVALFFGYTHCPDVCPTTLLEYANVAKKLGKDAKFLQVMFVTVDPERDTKQVLAGYVPYFNPGFIGMTGSAAQIANVMKQYKIVAAKVPLPGGSYSMDHTAGSYLIDRTGKARVYEPYGSSLANMTHDIRQLLR